MVPVCWRLEVSEPYLWPSNMWVFRRDEWRSLVVGSMEEKWGFHEGLWLIGQDAEEGVTDQGTMEVGLLHLDPAQLIESMDLPQPHLPKEWLRKSFHDQLVILQKTMRDIVGGIWESDIVPWLKTLK